MIRKYLFIGMLCATIFLLVSCGKKSSVPENGTSQKYEKVYVKKAEFEQGIAKKFADKLLEKNTQIHGGKPNLGLDTSELSLAKAEKEANYFSLMGKFSNPQQVEVECNTMTNEFTLSDSPEKVVKSLMKFVSKSEVSYKVLKNAGNSPYNIQYGKDVKAVQNGETYSWNGDKDRNNSAFIYGDIANEADVGAPSDGKDYQYKKLVVGVYYDDVKKIVFAIVMFEK